MKRIGPIRTCLGCGRRERKSHLLRLTTGAGGTVIPDQRQGRGGYLHPRQDCVNAFVSTRPKIFPSVRAVLSREARARYVALIEPFIEL